MARCSGTQNQLGALDLAQSGDLTRPEVLSALAAMASSPAVVDILVALDGRSTAPGARAALDDLLQKVDPERGMEALSRLLGRPPTGCADLWVRWAAGLPVGLAPAMCEMAVASGRPTFVLEASVFSGSRHLLVELLQHDLPRGVAVEAIGHLLRPSDDEGVGAALGYLERMLVRRGASTPMDDLHGLPPLSLLADLDVGDDEVAEILGRLDPKALATGWRALLRHGDALDRWAPWVAGLPTGAALALCGLAADAGRPDFVVQVVKAGASDGLLFGVLREDRLPDGDVEVLVRLLSRPTQERLGMAQAYLERHDGRALLSLLRLDDRVSGPTVERLAVALASDRELLGRLVDSPSTVLAVLVERARRELEREEEGTILKAASGQLVLRSRLVRDLAPTGSPRLVPLAAGLAELQRALLEGYVEAGSTEGLQALASLGDDAGVVLRAIESLGTLGGRDTYRWLNELLSGWFIGREVRRTAQEALAKVSGRLGGGGLALADRGGGLSSPEEA